MKKNIFFIVIVLSSLQLAAQNVGIGITTPRAPLHIFTGFSGNPFPFSPVVVEGSSNTYINLLVPDAWETGVLFGNAANAAHGGIVYNNTDPFPGTPFGFQFRTNGNITRMVLTSSGNLGINVANPAERLEVGGSIKATSFKYATPKTMYHSIPGPAFRTEDSRDTSFINLGYGSTSMYSTRFGRRLIAPIQLPHGAVMQTMTAYVMDNSADNVEIMLCRKTITSNNFPDNMGFVLSSGSSGAITPYSTPVNSFANGNIINNAQYSYYISLGSTGTWSGGNMETIVVIIEYTLTEG
jgi:hypothetical protein